ncbi:MAG: RNA methyltransferase substrate-binding domain-containing protein, partial [Anaerolineaceae bacterium]
MHEIITSSQNPRVQLVRSLLNQPKARRKQLAFTAEGSRLVEDGLRSSLPVQFLLVRDGHSSRVEELLAGLAPEFPIFTVETQLFDSLSETEISQGILAVFELPKPNPPTQPDFLLILDQVRDPGN